MSSKDSPKVHKRSTTSLIEALGYVNINTRGRSNTSSSSSSPSPVTSPKSGEKSPSSKKFWFSNKVANRSFDIDGSGDINSKLSSSFKFISKKKTSSESKKVPFRPKKFEVYDTMGNIAKLKMSDIINFISFNVDQIMESEKNYDLSYFHIYSLLRRFWVGDGYEWCNIEGTIYSTLRTAYFRTTAFAVSPLGEIITNRIYPERLPFYTDVDTKFLFDNSKWLKNGDKLRELFNHNIFTQILSNANLKKENESNLHFFININDNFIKNGETEKLYLILYKAFVTMYFETSGTNKEVIHGVSKKFDESKYAHPVCVFYMIIIIMLYYGSVKWLISE